MDTPLDTFLRVLDSTDTSVGGGSASAIAGAMAAALVALVARLSIAKPDLGDDALHRDVLAEADVLSEALFRGAREDAAAFAAIRAAYRLPKDSEAERDHRGRMIQEAMLRAADVPLRNAERCRRVLELCAALEGRANPNAASDLECARHLARAGVLGGVANVLTNVPSIKDERAVAELTARARVLAESTCSST